MFGGAEIETELPKLNIETWTGRQVNEKACLKLGEARRDEATQFKRMRVKEMQGD